MTGNKFLVELVNQLYIYLADRHVVNSTNETITKTVIHMEENGKKNKQAYIQPPGREL